MWVWPLWTPSTYGTLIEKFSTSVLPSNMEEAKVAYQKQVQRIDSMKMAWDVVPKSAAISYTQQWHMTTVAAKVGSILDVQV
jgi:hypothetical protein